VILTDEILADTPKRGTFKLEGDWLCLWIDDGSNLGTWKPVVKLNHTQREYWLAMLVTTK